MAKIQGLQKGISNAFKNLTRREQVLIYLLIIVIIISILVFAITLPAMTYINELRDEVSQLEAEQMEMQLMVSQAGSFDTRYQDSEKAADALKKQLYLPMDSESLDELITSFVVDSGMIPKSLVMRPLIKNRVLPYNPPPLQAAETPQETTQAGMSESPNDEQISDSTSEEQNTGVDAYVYSADITAEGNYGDLAKLLEEASKTTGFEVERYTYSENNENNASSITSKGTVTATVCIYVYMDQEAGNALPSAEEQTTQ